MAIDCRAAGEALDEGEREEVFELGMVEIGLVAQMQSANFVSGPSGGEEAI